MANAYRYDQLNRLKSSNTTRNYVESVNQFIPAVSNVDKLQYLNEFKYDANGNIENQRRYDSKGIEIDNLTYNYNKFGKKIVRNQLLSVSDIVGNNTFSDDIDNQVAINYFYDAEGRLVQDIQEGLNIEWRVDGKVKQITRNRMDLTPAVYDRITFDYDAMGEQARLVKTSDLPGRKGLSEERIAKNVYDGQSLLLKKSTYYILDAQGNQLSMYEVKIENSAASIHQIERNIYSSSLLGTYEKSVDMLAANPPPNSTYTQLIDQRQYAISNHLGNVLMTFKDVLLPQGIEGGSPSGYRVKLNSMSDYSPFWSRLRLSHTVS